MAVQMRSEGNALLRDLAKLGQAEHLESAAVGQDWTVPTGEFVQTTHICYQLIAGTKVQMIGIAQHHLCADLLEVLGGQTALDRTCGSYVLECGGLHGAVHRFELTPPGRMLLLEQAEGR